MSMDVVPFRALDTKPQQRDIEIRSSSNSSIHIKLDFDQSAFGISNILRLGVLALASRSLSAPLTVQINKSNASFNAFPPVISYICYMK
jgi:hypothetical protein